MPRSARALLAFAVLAAFVAPAAAQVWVPVTDEGQASPGLPAELGVDHAVSTSTNTKVDLTIHGYWREPVTGPDGVKYQRLSFPGLDRIGQVGAPDLPVARLSIAAATNTESLKAFTISHTTVTKTLLPLPAYVPGEDGPQENEPPDDTVGTEPKWAYDDGIYGGTASWPPTVVASNYSVEPLLGPVAGASVVVNPVQYDPDTGVLTVTRQLSIGLNASNGSGQLELTKLGAEAASVHFANWSETTFYFPNPIQYHSRYLIVADSMWWPTLQYFANHKRSLGFQVSIVDAGSSVDGIRDAIASWYQLGDPGMDHFALLVGDTDQIPLVLIFEPGVPVRSDDPYGCVGPLDNTKEVHVGRITADDTGSLGAQLQKIVDYELHPAPGKYHRALLVSHQEEPATKYTNNMKEVRDAAYAFQPDFVTLFGETAVDNQDVFDAINAGVGVVAYRGHGSTTRWADWSSVDGDLHKNELGPALINPMRPVVWSISCTNSNLDYDASTNGDSISEAWMEVADGAVASYGATQTTSTGVNHFLNRMLFKVVFHHGVTTHAKALELAETIVWAAYPDHKNPWAYLLLGDPSMTIRRGTVHQLNLLHLPGHLSLQQEDQGSLQLVATTTGEVLEDALVSVHKQPFLNGLPDEVLGAYWVQEGGSVDLPVNGIQSPGTIVVTLRDGDGNVVQEQLPVTMADGWQDLGNDLAGTLGAPRMAAAGKIQSDGHYELLVTDALPGTAAVLAVSGSRIDLPIFGGVLVPNVFAGGLTKLEFVNELGNVVYTPQWPSGLVTGQQVYYQCWTLDPGGPEGFAASNALLAQVP